MISAIPNQPINFLPIATIVDCPDKRLPLIVDSADTLRFQFAIDAPSGTGPYGYGNEIRDWDPNFDWSGTGSWVNSVNDGLCAVEPGAGAYIQPFVDTLAPTIGVVYQVVIDLPSISSTATFSMGGQSFVLSAPGSNAFLVLAATVDGPRITLDNTESLICVERVRVFEVIGGDGGCVITAEIMDANTQDIIFGVSSETGPEYFAIGADNVTISIPLVGVEGLDGLCIYLRASSSCNEGDPLCSQPIKVGECDGTIVLRACLDYDAMGFDAPAIFEARVKASLVRPRFEYDSSEERWSDGTINRYYVDRQRIMDLMIQPVDEALHPFLAALCMFDHVYIGDAEYSVDADGYEPAYGEQVGTAAVSLLVRPKRELLRRTTCDTAGPGCAPANDPPCNLPNVTLTGEFGDDGTYRIFVELSSMFGFVTSELLVNVDGADEPNITFDTAPSSVELGPYTEGQVIIIGVTNATVPECNYYWPRIVVGMDPAFNQGGLDQLVFDLRLLESGDLLVGGQFENYAATPVGHFTQLRFNGTLDTAYNNNLGDGFDGPVRRFDIDPLGRAVVAGNFTTLDGVAASHLARVGTDGTPDPTLVSGTGFNGSFVDDVAVIGDLIICVGDFTSYDGTGCNRIVGLKTGGLIDTAFVYGTGFNGAGERVVYDPTTDTVLVSSRFFTHYQGGLVKNALATATIVRLNLDGSLNAVVARSVDPTDPQFNGSIRGMSVQADGKIVVTGEFTVYDGVAVGRIARLNPDGTLDTTFSTNTGSGFSDWTTSSHVQSDGRILVGIYFPLTTNFNGADANGLVRLNASGVRDMSFNPSVGFNGITYAMDYGAGITYVGGAFTQFNTVTRLRVATVP